MHQALRSLTHFRKASLAVALGAAVASTVLTGALLTGDSVRGSLRDLTLERLGGIDQALVASRFFREELAADLKAAPLIVLQGTAVHGETGARAAGVAIYGIDARFAELHGTAIPELTAAGAGIFPPVVLNEPLRRELGVRPGDDVLLSFERPGEIPSETLLGEREADDVLATRRFTVARVLPERGLGSFGLAAHQSQPRTAFVPLKDLQLAAEQAGEVNAMVTKEVSGVRALLRLEDLGLRLVRGERHVAIESEDFYLDPAVAQAIGDASSTRIFTHLATGLRVGERLLPYSMVSGISSLDVGDGEILLNRWAADDLQARPGDPVEMSYLVMAPGGGLMERKTTLRLRGVLEMSGPGADRSLTPTFPGIENTEDMSDWDPPFPVDLGVIRPKDEEYWDTWGAAPKAFVSLATARRLWSTRFGDLTAIRVPLQMEESLRRELPRKVPLEPFGLVFQPVKREGLAAAEGSTDFAGLFLAFSFFLILSAVLLVGLLFSLSVERRAGELGLLLAVGYPISKVRRRLLAEGAVLAGLGSLLGLAGAAGYAWLLMAGLRSWWLPAVGTAHLFLHVHPASLAIGWAASVATVLLAVAWTVRRLSKLPAPALLAGSTVASASGSGRLARRLAPGAALVAVVLLALSWKESSPVLWMGIGSSLLVCGLALVSLWLRRPRPARHLTLTGMAARNGAASPGRSLLSVALVACACFVLVTVAANRREVGEGEAEFPLYAESAVPVVQDPAEEAGLEGVTVHSLYTVPGDDISCLNLFRPTRPRLLGVPAAFAGFDALKTDLGPDVIPAVADANSATWILKLGIGDELTLESESGRPVRIRLVGLLERSLFQSEVLISEAAMLRHFPGLARKSFFLIDGPPETAQALEESLSRYGFDVSTTAERLASYHAVEDTYLSTFQALGGFGLLLGTLGLGVALLRSLIERRGELATLRAFGFRRSRIAGMVVAENGFLLLLGVAVGTVSGLLAVAPHLGEGIARLPWAPLVATILAVLAVGLVSCAAAVRSALKAPLLPVLKEER
ncbi:MAG TPA: FtsX-like permease family protein [Thermoanaerobaculia bacterium]|nr:FtsX-like permease family protein [Thermoanaerobaculia bacterium]